VLWLLYIAILVAALVAPVFAFVSFGRTGRLKREIAELRAQVITLRHTVTEGGAAPGMGETEEPSPAAEEPDEIAAEALPETPPVAPPEPPPSPPDEEAAETAPEAPRGPFRPAADGEGALEETLTSRWLVWLGGATLALGGAFLVKYTIDEGLLGPTARVILGVGLGLAFLVAGEWLRRRPLERALAEVDPSYVPPAITAAGIFTLFASIYAAYQLYHLLSPLVAFLSLAGVAALAVALSLLQGPFMALLGLAGGFVTPLLVSTDQPSAVALFTYLLALIAGSLAVVRYMGWRWLAWVTLGGAALWPLIWFTSVWRPGEGTVLGIYLLAVFALFVFVRFRAPDEAPDELGVLFRLDALAPSERIAWAAGAAVAVLGFILVRMDGYGTQSIVVLGVLCALFLAVARREAVFDDFPVMAAVLAASVLATWHMPRIIAERPHQYVGIPIVPPELAQFASVSATLAALFGIGAFVVMWGARRPALWASVSAATPVVLLAIAYWRVKSFELDLAWAVVALGLAAVNLIIAERVSRYRDKAGMNGALGAFAVATVAALSLAVTMSLGQAWLTVALAVQLPAIAWIEGQLRLPALRGVMAVLAFAVLIRLVFNHNILDYAMGRYPGVNWLLYGYGIPSIAFYAAARLLRRSKDDWIVALLEAGALVFLVLLISLEIRHLMADGPLDARRYGLAEQSLQSISWAAIALVLYLREEPEGRAVLKWGWRILAGLAVAQVLAWQVLVFNPLFTREAVGSVPVFNILLLAYGAPAVFAALFAARARRRGDAGLANWAGVLALFLAFVLLSLEIRHAFHGTQLSRGVTTDGEWYAYSAGWLIYAAVLLGLGIWRGAAGLRYASLAIVMLTVLKVFAFDMSALTGIFRALSFLGLGLTLIGLGYFYRRFVFPPARPPAPLAPD
jgi:uncharacterized membrane protein